MTDSSTSAATSLQRSVRDRRVLLCVGPGGVGKTTCAAALALSAARMGRRVVVVTIDPSRRLAQALGLDAREGAAARGELVEVEGVGPGRLSAMLLDTESVFDSIVRAYAGSPEAADRILAHKMYKATTRHLGGALEYAAVARLQMLQEAGDHDLLVLDTPPTANAIEFLEAPARVQELITNPVARLLAGAGSLGGRLLGGLSRTGVLKALEGIGGTKFLAEFGVFLRDLGGVLAEFHRRAGGFDAITSDRDTAVVLVTSAAEFSVREAAQFLDVLKARSLRVDGVVLNRVDPQVPPLPAAALWEETFPGVDEALQAGYRELYLELRTQGDRASAARETLREAHPGLAVHVVGRREPPPGDLDALVDLGAHLTDDS